MVSIIIISRLYFYSVLTICLQPVNMLYILLYDTDYIILLNTISLFELCQMDPNIAI